jgi:formate hydrogenlyase transcriptional activator
MNRPLTSPPSPDVLDLGFDRLLVELAARFAGLTADRVGAEMDRALALVTDFLDLDRGVLCFPLPGSNSLRVQHLYTRADAPLPFGPGAVIDRMHWSAGRLRAGAVLRIEDVERDLPDDAYEERQLIRRTGSRSLLLVPVRIEGETLAILGLDAVRASRAWPDSVVHGVTLFGELLVNAIRLTRKVKEIAERAAFENLLMNISASQIKAPLDRVSAEIELGLAQVAGFLGADACALYEFAEDDSAMNTGHLYTANDRVRLRRTVPTSEYPAILAQLQAGACVHLRSRNDLPADGPDHTAMRRMGAQSFIAVPIRGAGAAWHTLVVGSAEAERPWPETMVPRLRLIGEVFASALGRKRTEELLHRAVADIGRLKDSLEIENRYLQEEISREQQCDTLIGESEALSFVRFRIEQVASTDATVLLLGETGTGKGLAAREIHDRSMRRNRPLFSVNCAALPAALIEAELFGHEKGAFSGAHARHPGRFEVADRSTLFLDEIGELPVELQAKLLRVLQDGCFERIGSSQTIRVNVRIVASTNRDLRAEVAAGRFREDLYYRLNVFPVTMPPLRERPGDVRLLAAHLAEKFRRRHGRAEVLVPEPLMQVLERYRWPGNIRELENVLERAVIVSAGGLLQLAEALEALPLPVAPSGEPETRRIVDALERTRWRIEGPKGAAALLDVNPSTLRSRMRKLGIARD